MTGIPNNDFDQVIQQILKRDTLHVITIESQSNIGNSNQFLVIPKSWLVSIQYLEGVLITEHYEPSTESQYCNPVITQMIPWVEIKRLYFDDKWAPSRLPFPSVKRFPTSNL